MSSGLESIYDWFSNKSRVWIFHLWRVLYCKKKGSTPAIHQDGSREMIVVILLESIDLYQTNTEFY